MPDEMTVVSSANHAPLPQRLLDALDVIEAELHSSFDRQPWIREPGYSKQSCLLTSLTVRDFLRELGFADANVRSVAVVMRAELAGREVHSLGIGVPGWGQVPEAGRFVGHIVAVVPSARLLIDTTLYPAIRPQWRGLLTGMFAVPYGSPRSRRMFGLSPFAATMIADEADGFKMTIVWLDRRDNKAWRNGGDNEPLRRVAVLAALCERARNNQA
jgi:hypothetical protein